MKTKIFNTLALTVLAFVVIFINSSKKAKAADKTLIVTELSHIKKINKIILEGNVQVDLTHDQNENLKVYDAYYSKNALVQWENGELRITSFEKEPLKVSITVSNLSSLEASGTSSVKSMNMISSVNLDIQLSDYATADLEARVYHIRSVLQDEAKLELKGEAEYQHLGLSGNAGYDESQFFTQNRSTHISKSATALINQNADSTTIKAFTSIPEKNSSFVLIPEF